MIYQTTANLLSYSPSLLRSSRKIKENRLPELASLKITELHSVALRWVQRVNPEIHDIFIARIGFSLIRVHRRQIHAADQATGEVLLQQLKWPIETIFLGMKVRDYNSTNAALRSEHLDKWHMFSQVTNTAFAQNGVESQRQYGLTQTTVEVTAAGVINGVGTDFDGTVAGGAAELQAGDVLVDPNGRKFPVASVASAILGQAELTVGAASGPSAGWYVLRSAAAEAEVQVCAPTLDQVTLKAHGIPIYNEFPAKFYNAYTALHYGGGNIKTPDDCGALMIPFNLYPGSYQPSGHINVSRAREFYLEYTSSVISSGTPGTLTVLASALNFLLISDGSAVLRYST